jgi:hypothetical protein
MLFADLAGLLAYDSFQFLPILFQDSGCFLRTFPKSACGGFGVSFTATGIAPDFNGIPF